MNDKPLMPPPPPPPPAAGAAPPSGGVPNAPSLSNPPPPPPAMSRPAAPPPPPASAPPSAPPAQSAPSLMPPPPPMNKPSSPPPPPPPVSAPPPTPPAPPSAPTATKLGNSAPPPPAAASKPSAPPPPPPSPTGGSSGSSAYAGAGAGATPPPPPPPSGGGGMPPPPMGGANMGGQGLSKGKSKVSASQGKVFLVLAVIVGFMLLIFSVLSDDEKKGPPDNTSVKREVARREVAPPPPPIDDITPPVPPISIAPPQPDTAPPPLPQVELFSEEDPNDEVRQERLRSGMVAYGGKLGGLGAAEQKAEDQDNADRALAGTDPNLAFQRNSIGNSTAPTVKATSIKGLHHTIAQGKLIHAVMETAVNTQLPGSVRAVVSRDIYAEAGYNVLIPKGSRLVGVYNTNLFQGQDRVFIIWNRVITPDGVDVMINSPATDNLGRAGVEGYLDSRYGQLFSAAILSSVLSIGVAVAAEEISGEDGGARQSQSVAPDGTFTSTGGSSTQAGADAAARIGSVGTRIMERTLDLRPRVTIDQGTPIKIMVNRDLIFPPNLASGANFIR